MSKDFMFLLFKLPKKEYLEKDCGGILTTADSFEWDKEFYFVFQLIYQ